MCTTRSPRFNTLPIVKVALAATLLAGGTTACGEDAHQAGGSAAPSLEGVDFSGTQPVPGTPGAGLLEVVNPEMPTRPLYKEFNEVPFGSEHYWTTVFENVGTSPVTISSAQAACGCTRFMDFTITNARGKADPRPTPFLQAEGKALAIVPVGATISMRMKLVTQASKPNQRKLAMMRLFTDSTIKPYLTFEVGFMPGRAFIFAPERANLLNSPTTSGKSKRIKILVDRNGDPERVLAVLSTPDGIEAELVTETFGGEYIWYVDVSVPPLTPLGQIRGDVVLSTTDENGQGDKGRLELPVVALVVPDVIPSPSLASLRTFNNSAGSEFTGRIVALVPGARLKVLGARVDGDHADKYTVTFEPVKAFSDGRALEWTYTVKLGPGHPQGYVAGALVFELEEDFGGLPEGAPANELRVTLSGVARDPKPAD